MNNNYGSTVHSMTTPTAILECGSLVFIDEERKDTLIDYKDCSGCDLFFDQGNLEHIPIQYHRSLFMRRKEDKKWDGNP